MPTVIMQERKKGVTYRIQICVKDEISGKYKTKTKTWIPPEGLTKSDQKKAALAFALEYEKKSKIEHKNYLDIDESITLTEYSKIFIEQMLKHTSANYYASCKNNMPKILNMLGYYRLNQLSPLIIQNFIDNLKIQTYIKTIVKPKPELKEYLKKNKIKYAKLARLINISNKTIMSAVKGNNISIKSAEIISNALQCPIEKLFTVISKKMKYSSESQAKAVRIFKHMMSTAKRFQIIDKNYATSEYVKGIEGVPKESVIMNLDEALDALEYLEKEQNIKAATAIMIGIYMGRRLGEVAGLKWTDIDLENGDMDIKRSRTIVSGIGVIEKKPKSKHSEKTYSMPQKLTNQLKKYKVWWDDYVEKIGDIYKGEPYLFLQKNGTPIHPSSIYHWLKRMQVKYNLKNVNFHSLRKTNISVQYASNLIPSEVIASRAGHANDKITKRKYMTIFKKDDKKTAAIVDAIFTRHN